METILSCSFSPWVGKHSTSSVPDPVSSGGVVSVFVGPQVVMVLPSEVMVAVGWSPCMESSLQVQYCCREEIVISVSVTHRQDVTDPPAAGLLEMEMV